MRRRSPRGSTSCSRCAATSACSTSAPATGALAFAVAPHVREVVAVDSDAEMVERARARRAANVEVVRRRRRAPPVRATFEFDLVGHPAHAAPHAASRAARRRARPGHAARRHVLVVDQLAPVDPLAALELNRVRARARPVDDPRARRRTTCARSSTRTARAAARARSSTSRATSTRTSTSPAAKAPSASARAASRRRATRPSSAGTCYCARRRDDGPGASACDPRGRPVPARHEDLAPVVVDRVEQPLDDERRLDDEARAEPAEAACAAGSPSRLDEAGVDRVHRDAARRELDARASARTRAARASTRSTGRRRRCRRPRRR